MVKQQPTQRYTMRVVAVKVEPEHLRPGDLYSDRGPEFWSTTVNKMASHMLFVYMNGVKEDDDWDTDIYRLTVVVVDNETKSESSNAHERHNEMSPYAPPGVSLDEWKRT